MSQTGLGIQTPRPRRSACADFPATPSAVLRFSRALRGDGSGPAAPCLSAARSSKLLLFKYPRLLPPGSAQPSAPSALAATSPVLMPPAVKGEVRTQPAGFVRKDSPPLPDDLASSMTTRKVCSSHSAAASSAERAEGRALPAMDCNDGERLAPGCCWTALLKLIELPPPRTLPDPPPLLILELVSSAPPLRPDEISHSLGCQNQAKVAVSGLCIIRRILHRYTDTMEGLAPHAFTHNYYGRYTTCCNVEFLATNPTKNNIHTHCFKYKFVISIWLRNPLRCSFSLASCTFAVHIRDFCASPPPTPPSS